MMPQAMKAVVTYSVLCLCLASARASEEPELANYMSSLQYFAHKAGLAIDAQNQLLAKFYAHEMEEVLESVAGIERYDAHPIGALTGNIMEPRFHAFEGALSKGDWETISKRYDAVLESCNRCHAATDHEFIQIERSGGNPYMQSFD